jgi:hypothetical protein
MSSLYSKVRQEIKQGNKKHLTLSYSPLLYKIVHIILPKNEYTNTKYELVNFYGFKKGREIAVNTENRQELLQLRQQNNNHYRRFFGNELKFVTNSDEEAERINQTELQQKNYLELEKLLKYEFNNSADFVYY